MKWNFNWSSQKRYETCVRIETGVRDGECLAGWLEMYCEQYFYGACQTNSTSAPGREMKLEIIENIRNPVEHSPCNMCSPSSEVAARISRKGPPSSFPACRFLPSRQTYQLRRPHWRAVPYIERHEVSNRLLCMPPYLTLQRCSQRLSHS